MAGSVSAPGPDGGKNSGRAAGAVCTRRRAAIKAPPKIVIIKQSCSEDRPFLREAATSVCFFQSSPHQDSDAPLQLGPGVPAHVSVINGPSGPLLALFCMSRRRSLGPGPRTAPARTRGARSPQTGRRKPAFPHASSGPLHSISPSSGRRKSFSLF